MAAPSWTGASLDKEDEDQHISHLHNVYKARKLRVLVGAGTSLDVGLPTWEQLSLKLLNGWIDSVGGDPAEAPTLHAALGRDGATDFIASQVSRNQFRRLLCAALYGEHEIYEFRPRSVHKQLAVMSTSARLYTTNYDPLLELALEELHDHTRGQGWRKYRDPQGHTYCCDDKPWHSPIYHLHGWIDPAAEASGPEYGGSFIITESHYMELPNNPEALANLRMRELLETEGATLIMGMSMEDPNVRRMLYRLSRSGLEPISDLYVILKNELAEDRKINKYVAQRWEQRKVTLLAINGYDDLPSLLRRIHWGMPDNGSAAEKWLEPSIAWIQRQLGNDQYGDDWQTAAYQILEAFCKQLRQCCSLPQDEVLNAALFVPMALGPSVFILAPLASTRRQQSGSDAREYLSRKNVPLHGTDDLGAINASFLLGKPRAARRSDNPKWDFPDEPGENHQYFEDRQSLLAIPVHDSPEWLPVAVMVITSNNPDRQWDNYLEQDQEMQRWLFSSARKTAALLISNQGAQ